MHNFSGITLCTGGSRGGARGARDPLTFKTKLKHPPPYLSVWITALPYLKVWICHCYVPFWFL